MASVYSANYSTGTYTYTRVRVDYSGTSATAHLLYTRTNDYSGATSCDAGTFTFGGVSTTFSATKYGAMTDEEVASVSFTISTSGGTYTGSTSNAYLFSFSGSVTIPAQYTPPTGLTVSNLSATANTVSGTVAVATWGEGTSTSDRYREINVSSTGTDDTRRYQKEYGSTKSSEITATNSSQQLGGMNITPNTFYYVWGYANNGGSYALTSLTGASIITPPDELSAKSTTDVGVDYATVQVTTTADGGYYSKTVEYSLDNGTTWTTGATVSSASATTATFDITGLNSDTTYTVLFRVHSNAGATSSGSLTFTTLVGSKFYGSVNGVTKKVTKLYGSVNGVTKEITKLYGSVNGVTKLIYNKDS